MKRNAYLQNLDSVHYKKHNTDPEQITGLLTQLRRFQHLGLQSLGVNTIFALDYTKRSYHLIQSPNNDMFGHRLEQFMEGGMDFTIEQYHKDDFCVINEKLFTKILQFLKEVPSEEHEKYVFTMGYRSKGSDGRFRHIMQKSKFITDSETHLPICSLGTIIDISSFAGDNRLVLDIEMETKSEIGLLYKKVSSDIFYPYPEETVFTKREREIILWLAEGLSGKEIADKLFISENTMANHRKNMLRKSNAKNMAQLVVYAMKNNII